MTHTERANRLIALVQHATPEEVELLWCLAERLAARRPDPGRLNVEVPRDGAGAVAGAVERSVDLALEAAAALRWAQRWQK